MVSDAAATKAPIAKIADKVSGVFVPVVISISVLTILVWLLAGQSIGFALARGISVLVISCPCALGLATPVAIMAAILVIAVYKNGVLTGVESKSLALTAEYQPIEVSETLPTAENMSGYSVKVFLWDSLENGNPYTSQIEY